MPPRCVPARRAPGRHVIVECEHVAVVVKSARGDRDGGGLGGHTTRMDHVMPPALRAAFTSRSEASAMPDQAGVSGFVAQVHRWCRRT